MIDVKTLKTLNYEELEALKIKIEELLDLRKKEKEDQIKVLNLIKDLGYKSIEDLGFTKKVIGPAEVVTRPETSRLQSAPKTPKLRIVKKELLSFYQDSQKEWQLITVPTVKIKLEKDGVKVVDFKDMDKKLSAKIDDLYKVYMEKTIKNYNEKISIYNQYAKLNSLRELELIKI